jgi:PPOX class probable F420-dependent enzyme
MQLLRRLRSAASPSNRTVSSRAHGRSGYDASHARTLARVQPMLAGETVVWLSTVRPDGLPHLVPTWFWWDGEAMLVCSKPDAIKVRNLRANPRLMVALGRPDEDFSVGLIEAHAGLEPGGAMVPDAFFAKYADQLAAGGMDAETYRATYTQVIRIVPTRFLAWHGRSERHDRESQPSRLERAARPARADAPSLAFRGTLLPAWA